MSSMRLSHLPPRPVPMRLAVAIAAMLATASAQATAGAPDAQVSLLEQRDRMPAEFREHLFGNPLTVRVELDGQYLGDAEVLLHEDNRVQLIGFVESIDSPWPQSERTRWAEQLAEPLPLGQTEVQRGQATALRRCTSVWPIRC